MKKFLKNIFLFMLFFITTYTFAICFLGELAPYRVRKFISYKRGGYGFLYSKIHEIEKFKNVDVLIIGTSHAYRGFDTRIFKRNGFSVFNLGSSIQCPIQTNILLERYLDIINPKLVIYDVNPEIFSNDGVEAALDLISNDSISFDTFKMVIDINNVKLYNTFIFSLYKQLFNLNSDFKENPIKSDDNYISGGFVEKKMKINNSQNEYEKSKYDINDFQLDYFDENIELLKKKNIPFLLVHTPIAKKMYESKSNYNEIDSLMNLKSNNNYYDFNKLIELSDTTDFYDDNHLNKNGVQKFDSYFIEFMKKEKILLKN